MRHLEAIEMRLSELSSSLETRLMGQTIALDTRLAQQEDAIKMHMTRKIVERNANLTTILAEITDGLCHGVDVLPVKSCFSKKKKSSTNGDCKYISRRGKLYNIPIARSLCFISGPTSIIRNS